jgi:hypothetical protein
LGNSVTLFVLNTCGAAFFPNVSIFSIASFALDRHIRKGTDRKGTTQKLLIEQIWG